MIEAKKQGQEHDCAQIAALVAGLMTGEVPDYQMAAWLMAVRWRGLSRREAADLTDVLVKSGRTIDLLRAGLEPPFVDKHSTGGVGDKLSLVVVPLLMAAGATVVKLSGAGLGHTGGTVDKLASIPGFRVDLGIDEIVQIARATGGCLASQTADLVPADGLIYALRDATATVDSLPLIAASIMSKKLAAGAGTIVLDVKVGKGALLPRVEQGKELAALLVELAAGAGRQAVALLTAMDEPLGRTVGNAIEVNEALEVLRGGGPEDVRRLSLALAAEAMAAAVLVPSSGRALEVARRLLSSGQALERLLRLVKAQGGEPATLERGEGLRLAAQSAEVAAEADGDLVAVDARLVGQAAVALGAGRSRKGQTLDSGAGIRLLVQSGQRIERGQPLAVVYATGEARLAAGIELLRKAFVLSDDPSPAGQAAKPSGTVLQVIRAPQGPPKRDEVRP